MESAHADTLQSAPERSTTFESTALPCLDAVYRFARSLTHDADDADDLVQDTFLRALHSWHTFRPDADCRRWLFAICHHAFLASRARAGARGGDRHGSEGDVDAWPAVLLHHDAVRDGSDEQLTRIDLGAALQQAIAQLGVPYRTVVMLVDGEGHSYEDAAALLCVPVGTVRSRLFRGRRQLQESLFAHARDAGIACRTPVGPAPSAPEVRDA